MNRDEIRQHLQVARERAQAQLLTSRIVSSHWPGGLEDRSQRPARAWLRRWRPERGSAPVPVCSCLVGRCGVCN